jgi:hypothetical protein
MAPSVEISNTVDEYFVFEKRRGGGSGASAEEWTAW